MDNFEESARAPIGYSVEEKRLRIQNELADDGITPARQKELEEKLWHLEMWVGRLTPVPNDESDDSIDAEDWGKPETEELTDAKHLRRLEAESSEEYYGDDIAVGEDDEVNNRLEIIENLLYSGLTTITGPGASGKTATIKAVILGIYRTGELFGQKVLVDPTNFKTFVWDLEENDGMHAWLKAHELLEKGVRQFDIREMGTLREEGEITGYDAPLVRLTSTYDLIFIDSLVSYFGSEFMRKNREGANDFLNIMRAASKSRNCAVVFVDHMSNPHYSRWPRFERAWIMKRNEGEGRTYNLSTDKKTTPMEFKLEMAPDELVSSEPVAQLYSYDKELAHFNDTAKNTWKLVLRNGRMGASDIAPELGVSRVTIYKALNSLEAENLVVKIGTKYEAVSPGMGK